MSKRASSAAASASEEAVAAAIRSMDLNNFERVHQDVNAQRAAHGFGELGAASTDPDIPSCDCCGKEYSANLVCSKCQTAFYCSKDCQRSAWKVGGHKQACPGMKQNAQDTASTIVQRMMDESLPGIIRVQGLEGLDCEGYYKAAIAAGIHPAIQAVLKDDEENALDRYRNPQSQPFSCTQFIMSVLFRGQRFEGRGTSTGKFRCIDGVRIKGYVLSDEKAFDDWFNASLAVLRVPLDKQVFKHRSSHQMAHMTARDIWAAWIMVFTNRRASKAILLGSSKEADDAAVARAKSIAKRIKTILAERWSSDDNKDPNSTLEGLLNQVAAMVAYWVREFKIKMDFNKALALKGGHKQMYLQMAVPLGEGTIKKGGTLTTEETRRALGRL